MTAAVPPHRPIEACYWVEPGRFLAGEYPAEPDVGSTRERLRQLRAAGVTFFLDLTEEGELPAYVSFVDESDVPFEYRRLGVRDFTAPSVGEMTTILDTLDDALARGNVVYLHCWGGIGRTGTVVACYLVRHGERPDAALRRIAEWLADTPSRGRQSPEAEEQRQLVLGWRNGQ